MARRTASGLVQCSFHDPTSKETMIYDGYKYNSKGIRPGENGNETEYFKCSKYGMPVKCLAGLIVYRTPGDAHVQEQVVLTKEHSCREYAAAQDREVERIDCQDEQRLLLEEMALTNLRRLGRHIYKEVKERLVEKYGRRVVLDMLNKDQSVGIVNRARLAITGGDAFRTIEGVPERHVSAADSRDFLQFNVSYTQGGSLHRITGFAHPELLSLLRYSNTAMYIDGTFKVTPKPYAQCLIVMVFDRATALYLPVFYILTTARDEWGYWHALHWLKVGTSMRAQPATVSCDFEWPIIKAVQDQFPEAAIVGCLFHWKQALRRKLINLRIPVEQISAAMAPGVLDLLTVVRKDRLKDAISHVKTLISTPGTVLLWRKFWNYFQKTWMVKYPIDTWNVSLMFEQNVTLINRTNNPLESYNRYFGEKFETHHPDLLHFIEVAKEDAMESLRLYNDVRGGVVEGPVRPPVSYPEVPRTLQ